MARAVGKVDPEAARKASQALAEAQGRRLSALRTAWAPHLHWERGRERVLATAAGACVALAARVAEVRADAAAREDPEPYGRPELSEAMADTLRDEGYGLSFEASGWDRYEQYQQDHPRVEWSDEMSWLRRERELQSALTMWWSPGDPGFDRVLHAWEMLEPSGVHEWGVNGDLSAALDKASAMAVVEIGLRIGRIDPAPVLAAAAALVQAEAVPAPVP